MSDLWRIGDTGFLLPARATVMIGGYHLADGGHLSR